MTRLSYEGMTLEIAGDGSGIYVNRWPWIVGVWPEVKDVGAVARSVQADEAVTLDYDSEGNLIGVEILARPKKEAS